MGRECGKCTTDHTLGSYRVPGRQRSSPWRPPRTPSPRLLWPQKPAQAPRMAGSGPRGGLAPSCWATSGRACEGADPRGVAFLHWGRVRRGRPASWEPAGAWAVGPAALGGAWASANAAADPAHATPPLPRLPCFPAEPKLQVGLKNKRHRKTRMP